MNFEKIQEEYGCRCAPAGIQMTVVCDREFVTGIFFGWEKKIHPAERYINRELVRETEEQLEQYFMGKRKAFELPLKMQGTEFQKQVWRELLKIPYGETRCYSEIARLIQNPHAVRAVGIANHRNPLAVVVPCHRVIGKDGALTGYAGGLERKRMLLDLEKRFAEKAF